MTVIGRRTAMLGALAAAASAAAGCAPTPTAPIGAGGQGPFARTAPYVPYDVTPMIRPKHNRKYLGATLDRAPAALDAVDTWTGQAGKAPNLLSYHLTWGNDFQTDATQAVWQRRMLPYIVWEPFRPTLREISEGRDDDYIQRTALAVRDLNVPVALSFAHEMNGAWYPWGTEKAAPAEFVAAWRHIHDIFQDKGVSNVIWVWSPSVIAPVPSVQLRPYYPGDAYVDWLGLVGYYTGTGPHTFDTLFAPTIKEVRAFTRNAVLIAQTAAQPGVRKPADIRDLLHGVTARHDVVGFIWFDQKTAADWRIDSSREALAAFRRGVADPSIGFDVRRP
ncbi:glycosyl hydrolase [Streptomyces sp. NPDC007095]|jgi:hypothetical protein|uniref:glycoside hydrolase family 26 protein n=1 Tax=Streptomyces sp. NPDC007095 TaxID=3154482 RepID=UPI000C70278B